MKRFFGTDGIRGPFGRHPLDRETVTALGRHLALTLREDRGRPGKVVLGGDTRASTPTLCHWLASGLAAGGADFVFGGTLPTAAVALLARDLGADTGIAVSASHNPLPDNGIKLIDGDGFKWTREAEVWIEERLRTDPVGGAATTAALTPDPSLARHYLEHLTAVLEKGSLAGLRIALDCANGAASTFAPSLFAGYGAEVIPLFDRPTGDNINLDCGSNWPATAALEVVEQSCDLGIAFDGDADRAVLIDETGAVRDGDAILYLWALGLERHARLEPRRIVATTMSNLGLEKALQQHDIGVVRCDVGDREVVDTLKRDGARLGGEQSGHIVHLDLSTTGDGLITALQLAALTRQSSSTVSEALAGYRRYPQVLINVPVRTKPDFSTLEEVTEAARVVESTLGDRGRLLLRYSGTESLARVMLEGPEQTEIDLLAGEIAGAIRREIGQRS